MPRKKLFLIFTLIAGVLLATLLILFAQKHKTDLDPLHDPRFSFQFYWPNKLPQGFHIIDKRIDIFDPDGEVLGVSADLNLRSVDWVYDISERKVMSGNTADTHTTVTNYDPASIAVTCKQMDTPKGTLYRLCHWVDYGTISVYEIKFIKGNTNIITQLPGSISTVVPESSLNVYVDSFTKGSTAGFKVISGL